MKIERFEDLICWQKAKILTIDLYRAFGGLRDFGFKDQILRAVVSVMNNVAEGYERKSNKELINFLFIAKGSCAEVRSMLYIAMEFKYINRPDFDKFYNLSLEISKMLSGFIKTL